MTAAVVFLAPIAAGFIQAVTGFGSGILMMVFFPSFFPILGASALSSSISLPATCVQAWNYRKVSAWKLTFLPALVYIFMSSASFSVKIDIRLSAARAKPTPIARDITITALLAKR